MALLDAYGRPIDLAALKREKSAPTTTGVRPPYSGRHPASGLTPDRLARILREAIDGDADRYLELAEDMEERDLHYLGVLGIRKRQVAGLEVTVEAASDAAIDQEAADLVRAFIERDTFADELVDVLDAIGKGYSVTEIIWDTSEKQWSIERLEWRDPRFFRFDLDRATVLLRDGGADQPLAPAGYITHMAKVKSGLAIRGGLARAAAWCFMFKSYTVKDWAIFCEAYGQPLRLGKYDGSATEADKEILLNAVASIGTDYAAIVPQSMAIDFVKADIAGSHQLYKERADWLDQQVSKAVLGQTGTTDAIAGGYAVGKVHDGVREDIERADCRQLAATINRDVVRPLCALNLGPLKAYPRLCIGRPDEVDVDSLVKNVAQLVPLGLKVGMSTMRDKLGLPDPDPDEELLGRPAAADPAAPQDPASGQGAPMPRGAVPRPPGTDPVQTAAQASQIGTRPGPDAIDTLVSEILAGDGWSPLVAPMLAGLEAQIAEVKTPDEARQLFATHLAQMDVNAMATKLAQAAFAARLAGEADESLTDET